MNYRVAAGLVAAPSSPARTSRRQCTEVVRKTVETARNPNNLYKEKDSSVRAERHLLRRLP